MRVMACLNQDEQKKLVAPWQKFKYDALVDGDMSSNYFWYILKDGIVKLDEVPEWAGVVFVDEYGEMLRGRQPKKLHGKKMDFRYEQFQLEGRPLAASTVGSRTGGR